MLPIVLGPKACRAALAGAGEGFARREAVLAEAGVAATLYRDRLPSADEIASFRILFVAGLDESQSRELARLARAAGVLVNVEDQPALCDFHVPARIRHGDLLVTVSTAGRAPGLARILRQDLEVHLNGAWGDRLEEIAKLRARWRAQGASQQEVAARTRAHAEKHGWRP